MPWLKGRAKGTVRLLGRARGAQAHVKVVPEDRVAKGAVVKGGLEDNKDKAVGAREDPVVGKAGLVDSVAQRPCDLFRSPELSTPIRTENFPLMRSPMRRRSSSLSTKTVTAS